ncbi:hypothetical protein [Dyella sp.]|uniref:hypothetical protein n=1 Tax=Dyella sp. TaxID=1869338 RepID=UPI002ED26A95
MRFARHLDRWHDVCDIPGERTLPPEENTMKAEALILRSLFTVCSLTCLLTLGAMLF